MWKAQTKNYTLNSCRCRRKVFKLQLMNYSGVKNADQIYQNILLKNTGLSHTETLFSVTESIMYPLYKLYLLSKTHFRPELTDSSLLEVTFIMVGLHN